MCLIFLIILHGRSSCVDVYEASNIFGGHLTPQGMVAWLTYFMYYGWDKSD